MTSKQVWFPEAEQMSLDYTYAKDAYSCIREFYMIHFVAAWVTGMLGFLCFFTRIGPPKYKWLHAWFGRAYIVAMITTTASSLEIHQFGLSFTTLVGLLLTLVTMCLGWLVVARYKDNMDKAAAEMVSDKLDEGFVKGGVRIGELLAGAKGEIVAQRTISQRVFSLKGLHGILMGISWYNIIPRVFSANLSNDTNCDTYPVFKDPDGNITLVPIRDPNYDNLPWAYNEGLWCLQIVAVPIVVGLLIGAFIAWCGTKSASGDSKVVIALESDNPSLSSVSDDSGHL